MAKTNYKLNIWQWIRYYSSFGLIYSLSLLPLRVLYVLSDMAYLLVYHVIRYRRKLVRKSLADSFPEKDAAERLHIEHGFYHWFCDYLCEEVKAFSISREELRRRLVYTNPELLEHYLLGQHKSVVLYLGHYCNWDWVSGISVHMSEGFKASQVYHVLENPVADKLMLYPRSRMGNENVPMQDVLRYLVKKRNAGQTTGIGMIADQAPFWNNIGHWLTFLNHPQTPVLTGAEKLARRFDMACLYLDMRCLRRGYYEAEFKLITDRPGDEPEHSITEEYYRLLEASIRRQPHLWLWTHKRWKRTREEYDRMIDPATGRIKF